MFNVNYEIVWIKIECDKCVIKFYINSKLWQKQKPSLCWMPPQNPGQ